VGAVYQLDLLSQLDDHPDAPTRDTIRVLGVGDALQFYADHILRTEFQDILRERGFKVPGSISSVTWECFGAILTGQRKKSGYGSDLAQYEIKSAKLGADFEYQYHKESGQAKLYEDMQVEHLFISYSDDDRDVIVRIVPAHKMTEEFFGLWLPALREAYHGSLLKQRFRKSVRYKFIEDHGEVVMRIINGELRPES
jgi:hypothetical protein